MIEFGRLARCRSGQRRLGRLALLHLRRGLGWLRLLLDLGRLGLLGLERDQMVGGLRRLRLRLFDRRWRFRFRLGHLRLGLFRHRRRIGRLGRGCLGRLVRDRHVLGLRRRVACGWRGGLRGNRLELDHHRLRLERRRHEEVEVEQDRCQQQHVQHRRHDGRRAHLEQIGGAFEHRSLRLRLTSGVAPRAVGAASAAQAPARRCRCPCRAAAPVHPAGRAAGTRCRSPHPSLPSSFRSRRSCRRA